VSEFFYDHQYAMSVTEYALRGYPKSYVTLTREQEMAERRKEAEEWAKSSASLITPSIPCSVCGKHTSYELITRADNPNLEQDLKNASVGIFCWSHGG
jgi:hypothetical protein